MATPFYHSLCPSQLLPSATPAPPLLPSNVHVPIVSPSASPPPFTLLLRSHGFRCSQDHPEPQELTDDLLISDFQLVLDNDDHWRWSKTSRELIFHNGLFKMMDSPVHFTLTTADCVSLLVGMGAAIASKQAGAPFTLNNFIAVCIVTELLKLLSVGSFRTAAAMLSGLLLYDVFWVFGSPHLFGDNVMVTVATSTAFEGPMKLIFPPWKENAATIYSVLGLGDVAAPGLLIALVLRFDRSRSKCSEGEISERTPNQKPDKTYFVTCMASYVIGLALTIAANSISWLAQPDLLYLVPSLLFGVFVMASYRSEASLLLEFKDEMLVAPLTVKNDDITD